MKKFLLGIVGAFILLGGVFLGACQKQVSLSVSTQDVVIYTNDSQEGQPYKEIEVSVENSDLGINVELLEGDSCVELQKTNTTRKKANGKYAFVIATKDDLNSGFAKVKVSAVEDSKENKIINVTVNTILETIATANDDQDSLGSNLYVVKGVARKLALEEYFDFSPTTANVKDIDWTFAATGDKEYTIDENVLAKIEGDELLVYDEFNSASIAVKASFVKNTEISNTISLAVIENASVRELVVGGESLYASNERVNESVQLNLKRNNEEFGVAAGKLVVNSKYAVVPKIELYNHSTGEFVEQSVATRYINFDITNVTIDPTDSNKRTYDFILDAQEQSNADEGLFGEFDVYFVAKYFDYNYGLKISDAYVALKVEYMATDIDMYNIDGRALNNSTIDVFSSYQGTYGYGITTYVSPEDVILDTSDFRFGIDINQLALSGASLPTRFPIDGIAKFYYRGRYLTFSNIVGSNFYYSEWLPNGASVYATATSTYENVAFFVETKSNQDITTKVFMNFYEITTEENLDIKDLADEDPESLTYLSSSASAEKRIEYELKVLGITSLTGLSLKHNANEKFDFSGLTLIGVTNEEGEKSVSVRFDVSLTSYDFEDSVEFWFEHITGRTSRKLKIKTFVPLETAYVQNASQSLSDVYTAQNAPQNFVVTELGVEEFELSSNSLSKLMVEVGSTISLYTSVQNATLNDDGISYAYLSYAAFAEDYGDGAQEVFDSVDFDVLKNYVSSFGVVDVRYFAINEQLLQIFDNEFKGFVCVLFGGYDEEHNEVTFARVFALEAVYSVRYMLSNVTTKLLYTTETLSEQDMSRSYVDVKISLRPDNKVPTYSQDFEKLSFTSAIENWSNPDTYLENKYLENRYYLVSAIGFANLGHDIVFRITAKSTNLQTVVRDILKIAYVDGNGVEKSAEIQLEIRNVKRIESVSWINRTIDDQIYLNLTSQSANDKNFTISTSVLPSDANDISLRHKYFSIGGSGADLETTTSAVGQTVNININTSRGGYGFIYLLPTDMVKIVDGREKLLLYTYKDADGNIVGENDEIAEEIPYYEIALNNLNLRYNDIVNGTADISPFFLNNDGKRIYYKDVILRIYVKIADGQSPETAVNIYNQKNLEQMDTAWYCDIMNNITLEDWDAFESFSGGLNGNGHTITYGSGCENFASTLSGTLKNITFCGAIQNRSGFIVNEVQTLGKIENCSIDVAYSGGQYSPSKLTSSSATYVGGVAGVNWGEIKETKIYGMSIDASNSNVGGIVGSNHGKIENCGVEFYQFEIGTSEIKADIFGGFAAEMAAGGQVLKSYVYNFVKTYEYVVTSDENPTSGKKYFTELEGVYTECEGLLAFDESETYYEIAEVPVVTTSRGAYAFVGSMGTNTAVQESFAYLGTISDPYGTTAGDITTQNCYISYKEDESVKVGVWSNAGETNTLVTAPNKTEAGTTITPGSSEIWQLAEPDADVNFGFIHLKNVLPSAKLDLDELELNESSEKFVRADETSGALMVYKTISNVSGREKAELDILNTTSIAELFGLNESQAKSLLLTTTCPDVLISANGLRVLNKHTTEFVVTAHLKVDYTQTKDFHFIIVNALPVLTTSVGGNTLVDDEVLLLQTTSSRSVLFATQNRVFLAGESFALAKDPYIIGYTAENNGENYLSFALSGNSLIMNGLAAHSDSDTTRVLSYLTISGIGEKYQNALKLKRNFDVSVYNGATSVVILDASDLSISSSKHAVFEVEMISDSAEEDIILSLKYGEVEIAGAYGEDSASFEIDDKLKINMNWTKRVVEGTTNELRFRVVVKIDNESLHKIDQIYENLMIYVNAESQRNNTIYVRTIGLQVETSSVEDLSITVYSIENRQIKNSTLYMLRSNNILTTLAPSSDVIVAVVLDPAYAKMTHFTLTYSASGTGKYGIVTMSRLALSNAYGYYAVSTALAIENGIRVNLTEEDRKGSGIYYFRLYVSGGFTGKVSLKLTASVYDGNELSHYGSHDVLVSALQEAEVKVDGKRTYLLAKGETAEVTVSLEPGQKLYDLYLENNHSNISLSRPYYDEESGLYKATLAAGVDARVKVADGDADSGVFYVVASVSRMLNGVNEIKNARVTVALVDFAVDLENTKVFGSTRQLVYNGKSYDAVFAYIDESKDVSFDYNLLPETYIYDRFDQDKINKVNEILKKRNTFEMENCYADENAGYYINYKFNQSRGVFEKVNLKDQLWYSTSAGALSKVYNANYDSVLPNDNFDIDFTDGTFKVTGKRSGTQLMMLRSTIYYQGIEFEYDYYFLVRVDVWTDEDAPLEISSAREFIDRATIGDTPADYILTSDIVLEDYTPVDSDLFNSFDGNGYTIFINSFAMPNDSTNLRLGLFDTIAENSTIKNVKVNIYNGGQIVVNASSISGFNNVKIAGFAVTNNGVIYNCEVVAYYDEEKSSSRLSGEIGLVVKYTDGQNGAPIRLSSMAAIESSVAGFVYENGDGASIVNSRVGGASVNHITQIAGTTYLDEIDLDVFTIEGQGEVAGFVAINSGNVGASFAKKVQILNTMNSNATRTAGFVLQNSGNLQNDYVEGIGGATDPDTGEILPTFNLTKISAMGIIAGFVYDNSGEIRNAYANIAIDNETSKSTMASGFVYINQNSGKISLCYAACEISKNSLGQMSFSGVDELENSLNSGSIKLSYFYNDTKLDTTNENKFNTGAIGINDVLEESTFYGFSFASGEGDYDGIWEMTPMGISLVSANQVAISSRYVSKVGSTSQKSVFYNKQIRKLSNYESLDVAYGSMLNPIIIRNAADFAKATGKATAKEISSYKEYYTNETITGSYRLVRDIDMSEIAQNSDDDNIVKLTTTTKSFSGLLDGNGFVISNIGLGSNKDLENFGLFATLENAVVMNLNLIVTSVHDTEADCVGVLAGSAFDSRILAIDLTPASGSEGQTGQTAVQGRNIVGGIVGLVLGNCYISDININSIYVESVYYNAQKTIKTNNEIINKVRDDFKNGATIDVSSLSYAGAAFGFVDVFTQYSPEFVSFDKSYNVLDFNIVSVHIQNAVNIYAEVAGGVFGYVGRNTMVYDAAIELDARMNMSNPSYIISRNLYAGGIVGECYGGLHAVKASYASELQNEIESGEVGSASYYNGYSNVERGQETIFSYREGDAGYIERTNNPLFIGGIAGFMGGGFIYVGYNKLNVIAHNESIVSVGGVVGLVGRSANLYKLSFVNGGKNTHYLFYDIYASGNTYADSISAVSGGIIGSVLEDVGASDIAFKDVIAANSYSYTGDQIDGNNHAMLIGSMSKFDEHDKVQNKSKTEITSANLYLISSYNDVMVNARNKEINATAGSLTVGGFWEYGQYKFGTTTTDTKIPVFGFRTGIDGSVPTGTDSRTDRQRFILKLDSLAGYANMDYAYARMYSYFIANGWEETYWKHTQGLYPEIELLPKARVIYWDQWNTDAVLEIMRSDTSSIVVIRGKERNTDDISDIDLRVNDGSEWKGLKSADLDAETHTIVKNFRGKIYSYAKYMNTLEGGQITKPVVGGVGGEVGQGAGLILNKTLFNSMSGSSLIDGVTFYLEGNENTGDPPAKEIDFSIINEMETSMLRNITIVANNNISLTATENGTEAVGGAQIYSAGLIARSARASSISDCRILFRKDTDTPKITLTADAAASGTTNDYLGVFVGLYRQDSSFTSISMRNLSIGMLNANSENKDVSIAVNADGASISNLHFGVYAGQVQKMAATLAKTVLNLQKYTMNYNITLGGTQLTENVYIGGYVGRIENINDAVFVSASNSSSSDDGTIVITQGNTENDVLQNLYAGLVIGEMQTVETRMDGNDAEVKGEINLTNAVSGVVNVGGFIGSSRAKLSIDRFKFDVKIDAYKLVEEVKESAITGTAGCSFGGIVGCVAVSELSISNCQSTKVSMDIVATNQVFVGGMIGRNNASVVLSGNMSVQDRIETEDDSSTHEPIDVAVGISVKAHTAYVGGLIGEMNGTSQDALISSNTDYIKNMSVFELDVSTELVFGGIVGHIDVRPDVSEIKVNNCVFGGEVDIKGNTGLDVVVGGIVGECSFDQTTMASVNSKFVISNCFAYGDIFINYTDQDNLLKSYEFGGIVGVATKMQVEGCYSLLTNFNGRTTKRGDGEGVVYNVGAIVGTNSEIVSYSSNYYSSGVVLAYQEESGNVDLGYLNSDGNTYYGYSGAPNISTIGAKGILGEISKFAVSGVTTTAGEKLNPILYNGGPISGSGKTHGITWVSMIGDVEGDEPVFKTNFADYAFVGNGHTFTRTSPNSQSSSQYYYGGFADKGVGSAKAAIISNLVLNLQVEENLSVSGENYFGGLVGNIDDKMFIYAVGVNGSLSIGREKGGAQNIEIGGLVGTTTGGFIQNCYVDADLIYRGGESSGTRGQISGIANINNGKLTTIANCFTSGMITPYYGCNAYAYGFVASGAKLSIYDCYSITQFDDTKCVDGSVSEKTTRGGDDPTFENNRTSCETTEPTEGEKSPQIEPLAFNAGAQVGSLWLQDARVNYGYDVQPFGFLRIAEIKVFGRGTETPNNETGKATYTYTKATISELNGDEVDKFYEVLNREKFAQVLTDGVSGKYILRYDIDLNGFSNVGKTTSDAFFLDGRGNTLKNYNGAQGLFGTLAGNVINLRMTDVTMTISSGDLAKIGVLANKLTGTGKINNIFVQGEITNESDDVSAVGGVVGTLSGTAKVIESIVNITNKKTGVTGGIVGELAGGTLSYASSNGIIKNVATSGSVSYSEIGISFTSITGGIAGVMTGGAISSVYNSNSVLSGYTISNNNNVSSVAGGIVGYLLVGTIDKAYNVGLVGAGNYNVTTGLSYAGGIFGYGAGGTVTNCMNDGAVQALSKVDSENKQTITIKQYSGDDIKQSGDLNVDDPTNNPKNLVFNVTLTYNAGTSRQVYAYGIGYIKETTGTTAGDTNTTSQDNIKNDGNVGEIKEEATITFDRYAMLDNDDKFVAEANRRNGNNYNVDGYDDGDYSFFAKYGFVNEGTEANAGDNYTYEEDGQPKTSKFKYNVSGQDSYGFASRIYMVDSIIGRQYGLGTNDIYNAIHTFRAGSGRVFHYIGRLYNTITGDGIAQFHYGQTGNGTMKDMDQFQSQKDFEEAAFLKVKVDGDDSVVKYASSAAFKGYEYYVEEANKAGYEGYDGVGDIDNAIKLINSKFGEQDENQDQKIVLVNGETTAIANTGEQFKNLMAPYKAEFSISSASLSINGADYDFSYELDGHFQFVNNVSSGWDDDTHTYVVSGDAYYAGVGSDTITLSLTLTKKAPISESMAKNNVEYVGGNTRIYLEDENGALSSSIFSGYTGRSVYLTDEEVSSFEGLTPLSATLNDGTPPYLELSGEQTGLHGKYIYIVANYTYRKNVEVDATYTATTGTESFKLSNYQITLKNQKGYDHFQIGSENLQNYEYAGDYVEQISGKVNLEVFRRGLEERFGYYYPASGSAGRVVIYVNAGGITARRIVYDGSTWNIEVDNIGDMSLSGNTLDYSGGNFSDWWVVFDKNVSGLTSTSETTVDNTKNKFKLFITNISAMTYAGKSSVAAETISTYNFYNYDVTYNITQAKVSVTTKQANLGYTLTKSDETKYMKQGFEAASDKEVYTASGTMSGTLAFDYVVNSNNKASDSVLDFTDDGETLDDLTNGGVQDEGELSVAKGTYNNGSSGSLFYGAAYTKTTYRNSSGKSYDYYLFDDGFIVEYYTSSGSPIYAYKNGNFYEWAASDTFVSNLELSFNNVLSFGGISVRYVTKIYTGVDSTENFAFVKSPSGETEGHIEKTANIPVAATEIWGPKKVYQENRTTYTPPSTTGMTGEIKNSEPYDSDLAITDNVATYNGGYTGNTFDFYVSYRNTDCETEITIDENNKIEGGVEISNIILESDLYLEITAASNSVNICGAGRLIKFVGDKSQSSLFESISADMKDLFIIGTSSLGSLNAGDSQSLLVGATNNHVLSNVKVYGSLRNAQRAKKGTLVAANYANIYPIANSELGSGSSVYSYVTVNVLDAKLSKKDFGKSVAVKIIENAVNNHNILISGDGANGANAQDRDWIQDGEAGGDGGAGGEIDVVADVPGSDSFAKAGFGGIGGYGGNGQNGYYFEKAIIDRGVGGSAGTSAGDLRNGTNDTYRIYSGLNGAGGFGRIYASSNHWYGANDAGLWKDSPEGVDADTYAEVYGVNDAGWINLTKHIYSTEDTGGDGHVPSWENNVKNAIQNISPVPNGMTYYFIDDVHTLDLLRWHWHMETYNILFMSGEEINTTSSFDEPNQSPANP